MIIERITFNAKYGKGDALLDVIRELPRLFPSDVPTPARVLVDRTGPMFTVVWDMEYPDIKNWASADEQQREMFGRPEFGSWFAKMEPLIDSGRRELFDSVEM